MKIVKFGGTSLATAENILQAKHIVDLDKSRTFIVVSAPGRSPDFSRKVTDLLIDAHAQLCYADSCDTCDLVFRRFRRLSADLKIDMEAEIARVFEEVLINKCDYDFIISRGEYLMSILFARLLGYRFLDAANYVVIKKNGLVNFQKTRERFQKLNKNERYVMGGFFGRKEIGEGVKTFTRGGSDYSAAIAAVCLGANLYENFTDTHGVQSANPALVKNTKNIAELDYATLYKLSLGGASVIYPNCVPLLKCHAMPLKVDCTFEPGKKFTVISAKKPQNKFFSITYETKQNINKDTVEILCVYNKIKFEIRQLRELMGSIEVYLVRFERDSFVLLTPANNLKIVVNLLHGFFDKFV